MDKTWQDMYDAAKAVLNMINYKNDRVMKLGELTPEWWID